MPSSSSGSRERRLVEVERAVRATEDVTAAGRVRAALETLLRRLTQVHDRCQEVPDREWDDYRTRLDIGLDDLRAEIARSAETDDGAELEKVLFVHCSRLELDGWRLHLDTAIRAAAADGTAADRERQAHELVTVAASELDTYSRSGGAAADREADINRVMASVRGESPASA
jgi:hypothetical protein